MPERDDFQLHLAWRDGDRASGRTLFKRYAAVVSRFFRTKAPDQAEDLTQSTFLALAQSVTPRGTSFRAYVFGVARNQLLLHLRGKARAGKRFSPLTTSAGDVLGTRPAQLARHSERERVVLHALQRLPVDYQTALELHYFEGLPLLEIADVLGRPVGTVKSQLSRGRERLREELEAQGPAAELLSSSATEFERWLNSLGGFIERG